MPISNEESPTRIDRDEPIPVHGSIGVHHRRGLLAATIVLGLLFLSGTSAIATSEAAGPTASDDGLESFAAFPIPNASNVTVLNSSSNTVYYLGVVSCTAGEIVETRVTFTQNSTGAVATGHGAMYCLGVNYVQPSIVMARGNGSNQFAVGDAHIDGWKRTQVEGEATDVKTWEVDVVLSESWPNGSILVRSTSSPSTSTDTEASPNTGTGATVGTVTETATVAGAVTDEVEGANGGDGSASQAESSVESPGFGLKAAIVAVVALPTAALLIVRRRQ